MFTHKGFCGSCNKHTVYLLWFVGGEGDKSRVKRQCVWCEETKEFLVERLSMAYLADLVFDEFEQQIINGCTEFYVLIRKCYLCQEKAEILILGQKKIAGRINIDGLCIRCRQKQSFIVTEATWTKQLAKIIITIGDK